MVNPAVLGSPLSRRQLLAGGLGLAALPLLASCASSSAAGSSPISIGAARQVVALSSAPDLASVVAAIRDFGQRFYTDAADATANFTASPLSLVVAFGMLRAGARTTTGDLIDKAFGFPHNAESDRLDPAGTVHPALNAITGQLVTVGAAADATPSGHPKSRPTVAMANGLFLDRSLVGGVQRPFLQTLATQYGAQPRTVTFTQPSAAVAINDWVKQQTRGRIAKLFDDLDPSTLLVLANAVYFKGDWLNKFETRQTADGAFTTASGSKVTARMMHQSLEGARYAAGPGWQRASLPYVGGELTMRVVLPAPVGGASRGTALAAATGSPTRDGLREVQLTLPRWDAATSIDLKKTLTALGLGSLYSSTADFSGIGGGLFLNAAVHRANVTVNESGTEAAAVTGLAMATSASIAVPVTMVVDRPFAWAIVHEPTGVPLFTGHVTNPTAT